MSKTTTWEQICLLRLCTMKTVSISAQQATLVQSGWIVKSNMWNTCCQVTINFFLVRDIKPPNNQSCFPQFFPRIFLSFSSWKKPTFYGPKLTGLFSVLDQWKVCFLFQLLKLRKIREKKLGKQNSLFGGLMSWTR